MEYNAKKTKPESNRKFLVQQVNEQSNLCDVTVKMGLWEKKFHRCVLVISPFFDHVLNDNFLEGQTGEIKITIGTPLTLETTIMFLYGKEPGLNDENIEDILHMAEFFLIPNLKSACIAWLKTLTVTSENCMKILQLSSIYDFEISRCTTYIEEHLPEMFMLPHMLNLTKDSIYLLFSDQRLSYVPSDNKLLFLLKWSAANPNTRKIYMKELLTNIDFHSISSQCLQACSNNPDVAHHIQSEHMASARSNDHHRVLIMKEANYEPRYVFWCLDFERYQWFRVESNSLKDKTSGCTYELSGICSKDKATDSIVCSFGRNYQGLSFVMLDLPIDACKQINFTGMKDGSKINSDSFKIDGNVCVVSVNEQIKRTQTINQRLRSGELALEQYLKLTSKNRNISSAYIATSTLYIGHIYESNVEMSPLLSVKDDEILKFAIGDNAIAIIFQSRQFVAQYDLIEGHLEIKSQTTNYSDVIAPIKDGFVIYDNKRCITFTRVQNTCLSHTYQIAEIQFEHNNFQQFRYFVCSQMIYRYYQKDYKENFIFECTPFQSLVSRKSEKSLAWKNLPLHYVQATL